MTVRAYGEQFGEGGVFEFLGRVSGHSPRLALRDGYPEHCRLIVTTKPTDAKAEMPKLCARRVLEASRPLSVRRRSSLTARYWPSPAIGGRFQLAVVDRGLVQPMSVGSGRVARAGANSESRAALEVDSLVINSRVRGSAIAM